MEKSKVVVKKKVEKKRIKTVKVKITTPFRYNKKERSGITRLPVDVANDMATAKRGKIL